MASLGWSQFKKRTTQNLRRFHEYVVDGVGFEIDKEMTIYGKKRPAGDVVKLIGIAYKSKRSPKQGVTNEERLQGCNAEDYKCIYPQYYGTDVNRFLNRFKNYFRSKTDPRFGSRLYVITEDKQLFGIGILRKTADFGGREVSMNSRSMKWGHLEEIAAAEKLNLLQPNVTTQKEFRFEGDLLKPGKSIEADWLDEFNDMVGQIRKTRQKNGEDSLYFDLRVGGVTIPRCVGAMGAPGASSDPKADIVFLHYDNAMRLKIAGYASLKDGSKPKDFQQWGGLSNYRDHEEVQSFVNYLKDTYGDDGVPSGANIGREIQDRKLKIEAVYGPNYSRNRYNSDSVQLIIQGLPTRITDVGSGTYELRTEGSIHDDSPTEMNDLLDGEARPVFLARKGDRSDFGVPGTRIFVYPAAGRSKWEWVNN